MALTKWPEAVLIPLDQLIFTPWNCNEMTDVEFSELVAEIEEHGFDEPAQVILMTEAHADKSKWPLLHGSAVPGKFLVVGGEHRVRAAGALEWSEVPVVEKKTIAKLPEDEVVAWSVKRNNIRGRINAQKYADLERSLSERHKMRTEVARKRMLVKGDLLKRLRKNENVRENEPDDGEDGGEGAKPPSGKSQAPDTDGERDRKQEIGDRRRLLEALKTAERDVLLQSGDTVEHGYLFFAQGEKGQTHLVVDESPSLAGLVKRMVAACKGDSARVDEFLVTAITSELENWESK